MSDCKRYGHNFIQAGHNFKAIICDLYIRMWFCCICLWWTQHRIKCIYIYARERIVSLSVCLLIIQTYRVQFISALHHGGCELRDDDVRRPDLLSCVIHGFILKLPRGIKKFLKIRDMFWSLFLIFCDDDDNDDAGKCKVYNFLHTIKFKRHINQLYHWFSFIFYSFYKLNESK